MATITTEVATSARWGDVQHALTGGGDGASCQCIWPVLRNKDWNATHLAERTEMFKTEVEVGPPPGIVAYADGMAAGWLRIGPRTRQERVLHTRMIISVTPDALDDDSVWAVTCFAVRREHRGIGLNLELLRAGIEFARDSGARVVEGYPVDTRGENQHANALFHGALSTFLAAGFHEHATLKPGRVLVRLDVTT